MIPGIDVSKWEPVIDWAKVAQAGYKFSYTKATQGIYIKDAYFIQHTQGARANGMLAGAYHYYEPAYPAKEQADYFLSTIKGIDLDLPCALDFEEDTYIPVGQVATALLEWLTIVEAETGKRPTIYTSARFWPEAGSPTWSTLYPLWAAAWTTGATPILPKPWAVWTFWQHSSHGSVPGIAGDCDLDRFNGTMAELYALAGKPLEPEITHADLDKKLDVIIALLKGGL
ncbi:MAG: glycoside hydrolase family 25 protein [Gallionella sp.]|jgi:lysozyme